MSLTAVHPVFDLDDVSAQLDKVTRSKVFLGSETASRLLVYLAHHSIEQPDSPLKEYEIATEVMGRRSDFDPRQDSAVRVQVARLRTKLSEYAAQEGLHDPYVIDIPRGSYRVAFTANPNYTSTVETSEPSLHPADVEESHVSPVAIQEELPELESPRILRWVLVIVGLVLLVGVTLRVVQLYDRRSPQPAATSEASRSDPALEKFWGPFVSENQPPLIVVSNAPFVGNAINGLYYEASSGKHGTTAHSYYTGIGEAMSIHRLDATFHQLNSSSRVRPGSLLTVEDLRDTNLIFVGAPIENLMVSKMITLTDFEFQPLVTGPRTGQVEIVNRVPRSGEPPVFLATSKPSEPLTDDYALVARVALDQDHLALVAAGTTTIGTEAAIDFLCDPASLKILERMGLFSARQDTYQLILHVRVTDSVPIHTEIVAFRHLERTNH